MKFEFVEFYPLNDVNRGRANRDTVGTVHIYSVECELDIRGIKISQKGEKMHFFLPQVSCLDEEGKKVRYPVVSWTNPEKYKSMMDFLHKEVKPKVKEYLGVKCKK